MNTAQVVALTGALLPGAPKLPTSVWRQILDANVEADTPDASLELVCKRLASEDADAVCERLNRVAEVEETLAQYLEIGIGVITEFNSDYPGSWTRRLLERRPPHVFVAGNTSLLDQASIGVVGSRNADPATLDACGEVVRCAVADGLIIVSGGAKGIDRRAIESGIDEGGSGIVILADGLERFVREPSPMKTWIEDGRLCAVSPFKPSAPFQVGNAMARNKLVYALGLRTVVMCSDLEQGGTWAGAVEAVRLGLTPVLVWSGPGCGTGNGALIGLGGVPLERPDDVTTIADLPPAQPTLF